MLVLDTDHLVDLDRGSATGMALQRRLEDARDDVATTIISWVLSIWRHKGKTGCALMCYSFDLVALTTLARTEGSVPHA